VLRKLTPRSFLYMAAIFLENTIRGYFLMKAIPLDSRAGRGTFGHGWDGWRGGNLWTVLAIIFSLVASGSLHAASPDKSGIKANTRLNIGTAAERALPQESIPGVPVITVTGTSQLKTLGVFISNSNQGSNPKGKVAQGSDGNFYCTTGSGGYQNGGTLLEIPAGSYNQDYFSNYFADVANGWGATPVAAPIVESNGDCYYTTSTGGPSGGGTIVKFNFQTSTLNSIGLGSPNLSGSFPLGGLTTGTDGNLYGVTSMAGPVQTGLVYRINPATFSLTEVGYIESGNGSSARGELVQANDGNFYGIASAGGASGDGTVFKMTTGGLATTVCSFTGTSGSFIGANPHAGLIQGSDGSLYGTTSAGGTHNFGSIFKVTTSGAFTSLYSFTNGNNGGTPQGSLVQATDGNLYGTASTGGIFGSGVIYSITKSGTFSVVYSLNNNTDGENGMTPLAGLIQGTDGNLYGTASAGGPFNGGTVFEIMPDVISTGVYQAFSYQVLASNNPTSYSASGLPAGFTIDSTSGLVTGSTSVPSMSSVIFSAANASGTGSQLVWFVVNPLPPAITSAAAATVTVGELFTYYITATNNPTDYGAANFAPGIGIAAGGLLTGTPTTAGETDMIVEAINGGGITTGTVALTFVNPVITSGSVAYGPVNGPFQYQITSSGSPASFNATNLPAGLSIDSNTGMISGTVSATGTTAVLISSSNSYVTDSAPLNIVILAPYAAWQNTWFTPEELLDPTVSGDTASPAGDEIPNLLKYALNLNPYANGCEALPTGATASIGGTNYLTLSYIQCPWDSDITYIPEVSSDLEHWNSGPQFTAPVSVTTNADGVTQTVVVQDLTPIGSVPGGRYIRLRVTRP
jgi:uncharacterized repeat protein (TIGR03803 family)